MSSERQSERRCEPAILIGQHADPTNEKDMLYISTNVDWTIVN